MIASNGLKVFDVALNGQWLARGGYCPIYIEDVSETPSLDVSTLPAGGFAGQWLQNLSRAKLDIKLTIYAKAKNVAERMFAFEHIASWANQAQITPALLTASYRKNQQLLCVCTTPPAFPALRSATTRLNLTLTSYACPYWQGQRTEWIRSGRIPANVPSGARVTLPGTPGLPAQADLTVTVLDGTMTSLRIQTPLSDIQLTGMSLAAGMSLHLWHDDRGILTIRDSSGAPLSCFRTPESSDDLWLYSGRVNDVTVTADAAHQYVLEGGALFA